MCIVYRPLFTSIHIIYDPQYVSLLANTLCSLSSCYDIDCHDYHFIHYVVLPRIVILCGVMVSVLAIGPKVRGFKPGRGDGFLRAIKIRTRLPSEGK
jgi:hypothetical protein